MKLISFGFLFLWILSEKIYSQQSFRIDFVKTISFNNYQLKSVSYGNPLIGYFKSTDLTRTKRGTTLRLIPPSYKGKIEFYGVTSDNRHLNLGTKHFTSPLPKSFLLIRTKVRGTFSRPFFLLSGALPHYSLKKPHSGQAKPNLPFKNNRRFTFPMIVNRLGEIIWVYIPFPNNMPINTYFVSKQVSKGTYGFLAGKKRSHFMTVNFEGEIMQQLDLKKTTNSMPLHHDFDRYDGRKFYSLGYSRAQYGTDKTYLSNSIVRVDITQKTISTIWDLKNTFNPYENEWSDQSEKSSHFVHWNQENVDYDFIHANELKFYKQGILMSFRHLNRIGLFDLDKKEFIWTLGASQENSIQAVGDAKFSSQHSPFFDKNGHIVLLDNGLLSKRTRIIGLRIGDGKAHLAWQFPQKSSLFSKSRGSVQALDGNRILTLFVSPKFKGKKLSKYTRSDHLIEFDYRSGKKIGQMIITFLCKSPGYRSVPLLSIGSEDFISFFKD